MDRPILQQRGGKRQVLGQVIKIGTYEYHKRAKTYQVEVFLLPVETVLKDWPEAQERGSG